MNMIKDLLRHPAFKDASDAYNTIIENQSRIEKKIDTLLTLASCEESDGDYLQVDENHNDDEVYCDKPSCQYQYSFLAESLYDVQSRLSLLEQAAFISSYMGPKKMINKTTRLIKDNHLLIVSSLLGIATVAGIVILFTINL